MHVQGQARALVNVRIMLRERLLGLQCLQYPVSAAAKCVGAAEGFARPSLVPLIVRLRALVGDDDLALRVAVFIEPVELDAGCMAIFVQEIAAHAIQPPTEGGKVGRQSRY